MAQPKQITNPAELIGKTIDDRIIAEVAAWIADKRFKVSRKTRFRDPTEPGGIHMELFEDWCEKEFGVPWEESFFEHVGTVGEVIDYIKDRLAAQQAADARDRAEYERLRAKFKGTK